MAIKNRKIKKITLKSDYIIMDQHARIDLYSKFIASGMSYTTIYYRFTRDGFKPWEIQGIKNLIKEFDKDGDADPKKFWESLNEKKSFFDFMHKKGMSRGTVNTKFRDGAFKIYELDGVKNIIDQIKRKNERI